MTETFISCDWGTSNLRLRWCERASLDVRAELSSSDGAARIGGDRDAALRAREFPAVLERRVTELEDAAGASLSGVPVVASGMVTSSIGWRELPYASLPVSLGEDRSPASSIETSTVATDNRPVVLVSGVCGPLDVIRGEETQIAGLLGAPARTTLRSGCLVILPGTHSKHVRVARNSIVEFTTYMTGELFEIVAQKSILRGSVDTHALRSRGLDSDDLRDAFRIGARFVRDRSLSSALFSTRARDLLESRPRSWCAAYLSGIAIGDELRDLRDRGEATPILIAADAGVAAAYRTAAETIALRCVEFTGAGELDTAIVRAHAQYLRSIDV